MIVERDYARARIVKGWAFMDLTADDAVAVRRFLETGDTELLPAPFRRRDDADYAMYERPVPAGWRAR